MASEHTRTALKIESDPRLLSGVKGVLEYVASRIGLSHKEQQGFDVLVEQACRELFPLLDPQEPYLNLTIEDFADRIEVKVDHTGRPLTPAAVRSLSARSSKPDSSGQVRYGGYNGRFRLTLVKYLGGETPGK